MRRVRRVLAVAIAAILVALLAFRLLAFRRETLDPKAAAPAEARAAIYRQPLVVRGTTAAVGVWLPELLGPPGDVPSARKDAYRAIGAPTLILWGAADTVTPLGQGQDLHALVPGSELSVLPGVGHIPQLEDPAEFNARLVKFLKRR